MFFGTQHAATGVRIAFTDRTAGNLALQVGDPEAASRARQALEAGLGLGPGSFHFMNQTHSVTVAEASAGVVQEADALISRDGTQALAVLVADCVPVVLVGATAGGTPVTAVAHAGRKGVEGDITGRTVQALRDRGADAISAWVGPSVCGKCYEVPEEMRDHVAGAVPLTYSTTRWGTPGLDLPAGVRGQLVDAGVDVQEVAAGENPCTLENESLFSHRAVGRGRPVGRLAGLVWLDG